MEPIIKYRTNPNDLGGNNLVSVSLEFFSFFGGTWMLLLIAPLFLAGRSGGLKYNHGFMDFILKLYNHPGQYYPIISSVALISSLLYLKTQLRFKKIISVDVYPENLDFSVTNKLERRTILRSCSLKNVSISVKKIDADRVSSVTFHGNGQFIGEISFSEIQAVYNAEIVFLENLEKLKYCSPS